MKDPGYVPYIDATFFMKEGAVHRMIQVADKINALRFNGVTENVYNKVDTNGKWMQNAKGKLQSAMLDTGRFLKCFDFKAADLLNYGANGALARNICKFIVSASSKESDKYLLIKLFSDAHLIDKTHEAYLLELDASAMQIHDEQGTSVVAQNIATDALLPLLPSQGPTDIAQLVRETPYDSYKIDELPFSKDNLSVVAKKKILKELKKHYADDTILAAIEELEASEEITDEKIKKLMETIIPPLASGFWSKLRGGPSVEEKQARKERSETLLKIPNFEKLFDDPQVSANRRSRLKEQAEKLGISLSEATPNSGQDSSFLNPRAQHKEKALGTITASDLLNKPNMTPEDKQHMQDVLDFMKEQDSLRTDENLKKLYNNVHYHHNAIEI